MKNERKRSCNRIVLLFRLNRWKWLFVSLTIISFLMVLMISSVVKAMDENGPLPHAETKYVSGFVSALQEDVNQGALQDEIINTLSMTSEPFVLLSEEFSRTSEGYSVYFSNNSSLDIDITEGRNLQLNDLNMGCNYAIVSESHRRSCYEDDDIIYMDYDSHRFEVIGVYKDFDRKGYSSPAFFIPYTSKALRERGHASIIVYSNNPSALMLHIKQTIESKFANVVVDFSEEDIDRHISSAIHTYKDYVIMLILLNLFIVLNTISICESWISGQLNELRIRYLCGATHAGNKKHITARFLSLAGGAFLTGFVLAACFIRVARLLPIAETVLLVFGSKINYMGSATAMIINLAIGYLVVMLSFGRTQKNNA